LLTTKEYVALKYATLEESDTLLQMKLKAHRLSLAEDEDEWIRYLKRPLFISNKFQYFENELSAVDMRSRKFAEFRVRADNLKALMSSSLIFKKTIKWRLPISDEK